MSQSIKQLYGNKLAASDGEIGQVKDFYFDDLGWGVRFLVADTGTWLPGRQVLISPHSLGPCEQVGTTLRVNLTRKQIEQSPSIETRKPVSRQFEEVYYQYYNWPFYWMGGDLWGMSGVPGEGHPANPTPRQSGVMGAPYDKPADAHLRSAQAVGGYQFKTNDGIIGHISDFMMDPKTWAIRHLLVRTGSRLSGKEVEIPVTKINRISYDESTVYADLTGEAVQKSPRHQTPSAILAH